MKNYVIIIFKYKLKVKNLTINNIVIIQNIIKVNYNITKLNQNISNNKNIEWKII
jgi:hypothetical protein